MEIEKKSATGRRLNFVMRAMGKDTTRPFFNVIHVESTEDLTVAVATDGCRLHYAEIKNCPALLPAGDYEVIPNGKCFYLNPKENVSFPPWKRIIPGYTTELLNFESSNITGIAVILEDSKFSRSWSYYRRRFCL